MTGTGGRPRVAIDIQTLVVDQKTGVARVLTNLLPPLLREDRGIDFLLYLPEWLSDGGLGVRTDDWKAEFRPVPCRFSQKRIWENFALPRALRADSVDLLLSPNYVLPLWLPCPGVVIIYDISYEAHPEWFPPLRSQYVRLLSRRSAKKARLVITISEFSRTEITRHYRISPARVRNVSAAADPKFFREVGEEEVRRVRDKYHLPERFVLHVGSLHQRRQVPELLKAIGMLHREKGFEQHLILLGHNNFHPPTDISELIAEAEVEQWARHLAFVPEEDLLAFYAASELVVYVSRYEGFGLPVLEAMAAGRPVVTSNTTSLEEVAEGAACLVDPTDPREIAEGIRQIVEDRALREDLISKGRKRAASFSWEKTAEKVLAALRDALRVC